MELEFASQVCIGVMLCLLIIFSAVGNVGVISVIYKVQSLHKKENIFVVSLAVSDLIQVLLGLPLDGTYMVLGYWPFGEVVYCFFVNVIYVSSTSSIFAICAVSISRYLLIKEPFKYNLIMSKATVVTCVAAIWCVPLLLLSFFYGVYGVHQPVDPMTAQCSFTIGRSGAFVYSALTFYLPALVMIFIYYRLYFYSRLQLANISKLVPNSCSKVHHKAVLTIGFIMGAYLFCWLPFFLFTNFYQITSLTMPSVLYNMCLCLGYLNSLLNPIIYSLMNREFRDSVHKVGSRRDWWAQSDL